MKISCEYCELIMINIILCHEIGCPNSRKMWVNGKWENQENDEFERE